MTKQNATSKQDKCGSLRVVFLGWGALRGQGQAPAWQLVPLTPPCPHLCGGTSIQPSAPAAPLLCVPWLVFFLVQVWSISTWVVLYPHPSGQVSRINSSGLKSWLVYLLDVSSRVNSLPFLNPSVPMYGKGINQYLSHPALVRNKWPCPCDVLPIVLWVC